jgi:hypothetical protein
VVGHAFFLIELLSVFFYSGIGLKKKLAQPKRKPTEFITTGLNE